VVAVSSVRGGEKGGIYTLSAARHLNKKQRGGGGREKDVSFLPFSRNSDLPLTYSRKKEGNGEERKVVLSHKTYGTRKGKGGRRSLWLCVIQKSHNYNFLSHAGEARRMAQGKKDHDQFF